MRLNLEKILSFGRRMIPAKIFNKLAPIYHFGLAFLAALIYGFPSRKIFVLGVTGTKGKTSILEITNAILEDAGYKTALISTLRFKIGKDSRPNELKMTMPGRFFIQRFLRKATGNDCRYVLMEMTSQGALQFRDRFISLNAMIFSNLAPEHIEAHGSFENYRDAKLKFFASFRRSFKNNKVMIVNTDDKNADYFLKFKAGQVWMYGLKDNFNSTAVSGSFKKLYPSGYRFFEGGIEFAINKKTFRSSLLSEFNLYNILAAVAFARSQSIDWEVIRRALGKFSGIAGRLEFIKEGQGFKVVVDYAHTSQSLEKVYELFKDSRKICVLGATGGGRDKWKRKEMGKIAAVHCNEIILTNEDPYDENPSAILENIAEGFSQIPNSDFYKILDRREAIRKAMALAETGDTIIITGKGTDPWIMGPHGSKIKWDDRQVVREELRKLLSA